MNDIVSRPPPLDTSADAQLRSEAAAIATHAERKPRIVIVGGGFGGVAAARALRKSDAEVFLIDRRNHHIFQPLLYQVATAVLSPSEVAAPIRQLARKQKNLSVMLAEVRPRPEIPLGHHSQRRHRDEDRSIRLFLQRMRSILKGERPKRHAANSL